MSHFATMRRAMAESQPAAPATAEYVPAKTVEAIAAQVIDHVALSKQVAAKWAPVAATESDPLAASAQPGDAAAENHGWGSIIAALPTTSGAVKVEIEPPSPQAMAEWAFVE